MEHYLLNGATLYSPSLSEWERLAAGNLASVDEIPIHKFSIEHFFKNTISTGMHSTPTTQAFLRIPALAKIKSLQKLYPVLLRWPTGKPRLIEGREISSQRLQRVYYHQFHCFDCGLNLCGLALSADDYYVDDLMPSLFSWEALGCPICGGGMRYPNLVEIVQILD